MSRTAAIALLFVALWAATIAGLLWLYVEAVVSAVVRVVPS